jgi:hypothetical protein
MFQVPVDRTRQNDPLKIPSFAQHVFHRVPMRDAHDILFNDWSLVQSRGHIMTRRSNQLDPALKSLVIRFSTNESRKKRMVNIDQP